MITFEDDRRTRAEQRVIASLLKSAKMIRHCAQLTPRDFSHELHGMAYRAIVQLIERGECVSALTVCHEIVRMRAQRYRGYRVHVPHGRAPDLGYLMSLETGGAVPSNVGYYAAVMLEGVKP